jgi:FkbM family methyltransferase
VLRILKKLEFYYANVLFNGFLSALKIIVYDLIYIFYKYIFKKTIVKKKIYDYKMYLNIQVKGISKVLFIYGHREDDHREILLKELKKGDRVLDIGANIGYYALMEAMIIGEDGVVYAVEPDQRNLQLLKKNIILNHLEKTIQIFDKAISNKNGVQQFALHSRSNLNVILYNGERPSEEPYQDIIKIETIDIYNFLRSIGKTTLLRMDVEGHEVDILKRISQLKERYPEFAPKKLLFEVHPWRYNIRHNMKDRLITLFHLGYYVKTICSSDEKIAFPIRKQGYIPWKIVRSDLHERGLYNFIKNEDAIKFICDIGCVRSVLLVKDDNEKR